MYHIVGPWFMDGDYHILVTIPVTQHTQLGGIFGYVLIHWYAGQPTYLSIVDSNYVFRREYHRFAE